MIHGTLASLCVNTLFFKSAEFLMDSDRNTLVEECLLSWGKRLLASLDIETYFFAHCIANKLKPCVDYQWVLLKGALVYYD